MNELFKEVGVNLGTKDSAPVGETASAPLIFYSFTPAAVKGSDREPLPGATLEERLSDHSIPSKAERITFDVWQNGHPDNIVGVRSQKFDAGVLARCVIPKIIADSRKIAAGLREPMLTVQADIGQGVIKSYRYADKQGAPPNANSPTIKPIFDQNIQSMVVNPKTGRTLVYHASLSSPTLAADLDNLNELIKRFFRGENVRSLIHQKDQNTHFAEIIVDGESLRAAEDHHRLYAKIITAGGKILAQLAKYF